MTFKTACVTTVRLYPMSSWALFQTDTWGATLEEELADHPFVKLHGSQERSPPRH